jgi:hypothetical protein
MINTLPHKPQITIGQSPYTIHVKALLVIALTFGLITK